MEAIEIFEITESQVTPELIKTTYRKLCAKYHPDRNPNGLEKMKLINMAYQVLKDFQKEYRTFSEQRENRKPRRSSTTNKEKEPKDDTWRDYWDDIYKAAHKQHERCTTKGRRNEYERERRRQEAAQAAHKQQEMKKSPEERNREELMTLLKNNNYFCYQVDAENTIWIGGDTFSHKEVLKVFRCRWDPDKKMWNYKHTYFK